MYFLLELFQALQATEDVRRSRGNKNEVKPSELDQTLMKYGTSYYSSVV